MLVEDKIIQLVYIKIIINLKKLLKINIFFLIIKNIKLFEKKN